MNLDLNELGTTLGVGIFALSAFSVMVYAFFPVAWRRRLLGFLRPLYTIGGPVSPLMLVVVILAGGLIGEDLSNKFVDIDSDSGFIDRLLPSEGDLRSCVLFGEGAEWAQLSKELASSGRLSQLVFPVADRLELENLETLILEGGAKPGPVALKELAERVYYPAKNTIFAHPVLGNELRSIQVRIDFARSLALFAALSASISVFLLLARWILETVGAAPSDSSARRGWGAKGVAVVGAFACVAWLAVMAYTSEEREFNVRCFGYFATLDESSIPTIKNAQRFGVPSISGLAEIGAYEVLAVHDYKAGLDPHRVRVSMIDAEAIGTQRVQPLQWMKHRDDSDPPSDLESICRVGGTASQTYLAAESGYYEVSPGDVRYGRVFLIELRDRRACEVTHVWRWPKSVENIEGIACQVISEKPLELGVYVAERAGDIHYCRLSPATSAIEFLRSNPLPDGLRSRLVGFNRLITDLHIDSTGTVWGVASQDIAPEVEKANSGMGPFRSRIYSLGPFNAELSFVEDPTRERTIDGFKVEGLSKGILDGTNFTIGTDDEELGGVWRPVE